MGFLAAKCYQNVSLITIWSWPPSVEALRVLERIGLYTSSATLQLDDDSAMPLLRGWTSFFCWAAVKEGCRPGPGTLSPRHSGSALAFCTMYRMACSVGCAPLRPFLLRLRTILQIFVEGRPPWASPTILPRVKASSRMYLDDDGRPLTMVAGSKSEKSVLELCI